jgi:hypothetical protein
MKVRGAGGHLGSSVSKRWMVCDECTALQCVSCGDALDSSSRTPVLLTRLVLFVEMTGGFESRREYIVISHGCWLELRMGGESWK